MRSFILALDQGTTSSRAIIYDREGLIAATAQKELTQIFPEPGKVEHDPNEIWTSTVSVAIEAMAKLSAKASEISAIGITNQRETTLVWDRVTGEPICNAIVWQDRRTSEFCKAMKQKGLSGLIREKTGLVIDAYFSGSKINWILANIEGARSKAQAGQLAFGTVDSWLVYKLTGGRNHITDVTNASRTMLFNIHTCAWDAELLELFGVPRSMLAEVKQCSELFCHTDTRVFSSPIPIAGIAGDQHAALFGQMCTIPAMVKNTYGTGCFMLMNTGTSPVVSKNNLLTTIAYKINNRTYYALEGSIFIAGAVVQWLRDGLGIIRSSAEVETLALQVEDTGGVYFVPAFTGLGAPYWDQGARGALVGLSRGSTSSHIARAALESIAYQTMDVLEAMENDAGFQVAELRVDGGATGNDLLMQFQANILGCEVVRPMITETTSLGAAYLAGLAVEYWENIEEISKLWKKEKVFRPAGDPIKLAAGKHNWHNAVAAARVFQLRK